MKSAAEKENKLDPRVPVLAGVLVLALAGAGISWRLSQAPAVFAEASAEPAKPAATSAQQMSDDAARLLASSAASQAEDAEVLETNWPAVQPPKAAPVAAAQPEERTFRLRGIIRGGVQPVLHQAQRVQKSPQVHRPGRNLGAVRLLV